MVRLSPPTTLKAEWHGEFDPASQVRQRSNGPGVAGVAGVLHHAYYVNLFKVFANLWGEAPAE